MNTFSDPLQKVVQSHSAPLNKMATKAEKEKTLK